MNRLVHVLVALVALACVSAADYQLRSSTTGAAGSGGTAGAYRYEYSVTTMAGPEGASGTYVAASGFIAQARMAGFVNVTPTLDPIDEVEVLEDSGITTLILTGITDGSDSETQALTVSARSSDQSVVLDPSIVYSSPASTAELRLAPVANAAGTATITVSVRDSGGTLNGAVDRIQRSFVVTLIPVNDAPSIAPVADVVIDEDASQQVVALTGIGTGATNETQQISVRAFSSDTTVVPNPTVSYSSPNATGSLTFTPVPNSDGRVNILVVVQDSGGTDNGGVDTFSRVFSVDVQPQNDAPVLVTNVGLTVQQGKSGIISFDLLRAVDDDPPAGLTFHVDSVPTAGDLRRDGTSLIGGESFTQADINAGHITYLHAENETGSDSFTFFVSDPDGLTTLLATFAITIIPASTGDNQVPVVTLANGVQTWVEGDGPLLLDSSALVSDADGTLASGVLTVSVIEGGEADDRLGVRNLGAGPGQIGVSGSIVTYAGSTLGVLAGGAGTNPLTVSLGGSATPVQVEALVRALTYRSDSDAPPENDRLIQVVLDDGAGGTSAPVVATISVKGINTAPEVAFQQTAVAYVEDSGPVLVDAAVLVDDADSADFDGGELVLALSSGGAGDDVLGILSLGSDSGEISVAGTSVAFEGTVIGSFTGGTDGVALSVTLNAAATPAAVQALARALTFRNDSDDFDSTTRTLALTISDGDGGASDVATLPVVLTATNDDPLLTVPAPKLGYTEGDGAVAVAGDASVSDPDSPEFSTGLLRVVIASGATADDRIEIADVGSGPGEISLSGGAIAYEGVQVATYGGSVTGSTEMLIAFDDGASPAAAEALVRAVRFRNPSAAPTSGDRSIELQLSDGDGGSSGVVGVTITVTDVNSPPQLVLSGSAPDYIENEDPVIVDGGVAISDADSANFDDGNLIVAIRSGGESGDRLALADRGFAAGEVGLIGTAVYFSGQVIGSLDTSDDTRLVVSFNFSATAAGASAVASAVTFAHAGEDPATAVRTISYVIADGDGDVSPDRTTTVSVQAVNDAPSAADSTLATMPGITRTAVLPGTDAEGDPMTFTLLSQPDSGSITLDDSRTGAITYTPGAAGGDRFTYRIDDGTDSSTVIAVDLHVTTVDDERPRPLSAPPLAVDTDEGLSYDLVVDVSQLNGSPDLDFSLITPVPSGATLIKTGATTATITWPAGVPAGDHVEFEVLFVDPVANRAGVQRVYVLVEAPTVSGNG